MRWLGISLFLVFLSIAIVSADTYLYCTDSDSGLSYSTAGHVNYSWVSFPQQNEIQRVNDSCDGMLVQEYYCGSSGGGWTLNSSTVDCGSLGYTGCSNGACYGSATCSDTVQNGQESDVDCGGFACEPCSGGQTCTLSSDCDSSVCNGGTCLPAISSPLPVLNVTLGPLNPGDHSWSFGDNPNNTMMQLVLRAHYGTVRVEVLTIKASGTGNDSSGLRRIYLAEDMNFDGRYTPNEYQWARGTYNHDNGEFTMRFMPTLELDGTLNESVTLLIVYEMQPSVMTGQTFTVQVGPVFARSLNNTYIGKDLSADTRFRTTKTITSSYIPPMCNVNGVRDFDEAGVDCGGAYCPTCVYIDHCTDGVLNADEQNVDCGGSCPTCIPSVCIPNEQCDPANPPLCDAMTRTVSICLSGFWSTVAGGYDSYCPDSGVCTPGTFLCDHQQRGVRECLQTSQWGPNVVLDSLYTMHCSNRGCEPGASYCFENEFYVCGNDYTWVSSPEMNTCNKQECDWGQMTCDYARSTVTQCRLTDPLDPLTAHWETLETSIIPGDDENPEQRLDWFELYCLPSARVCDENTQRCNFESQSTEICSGGEWETRQDPGVYATMCEGRECNAQEFLCNPFEETVAFCTNAGVWGTGAQTEYTRLCESSEVTPGVTNTTNVPFAMGGKRTLVGVQWNNTVIAYRFLAPAPDNKSESFSYVFGFSFVPWILVLILIATTVYFGLKYRACSLGSSLGTRKKSTK